jgi:hypothetical protein
MRPFVLDAEDLTEEVVDDAGKSTPAAVAKTLDMMQREIARGRLIRQSRVIKVPVLAIAGEEDQIVDPQAASDWARTLPVETVFLNECGHLPMLERTDGFNAQVLTFLTGDPRYLDAAAAPPEEIKDVAETPEETPPLADVESGDPAPGTADPGPPNAARQQDGRYPSRDREPEGPGDPYDASKQPGGQEPDRSTTEPIESDGAERRTRGHTENGGDTGVPEVPKGLFEWPDSLKKSRPWDRSGETDRQAEEERNEDTDPGEPENGPRS